MLLKKTTVPTRPANRPSWMFDPVDRPSYADNLKFPDNVATVASAELSMLHGRYTSMYAYAASELSMIRQNILRYRSEQYSRKLDIQRTGFTYNKRKGEIDVNVRLDKTMQNFDKSISSLEQQEVHVAARVDIFEKYMYALSREMTRRASEIQKT